MTNQVARSFCFACETVADGAEFRHGLHGASVERNGWHSLTTFTSIVPPATTSDKFAPTGAKSGRRLPRSAPQWNTPWLVRLNGCTPSIDCVCCSLMTADTTNPKLFLKDHDEAIYG